MTITQKPIREADLIVSHHFDIPAGVTGIRYEDEMADRTVDLSEVGSATVVTDSPVFDDSGNMNIAVPDTLTIISQTARTTSTGNVVVDVVIEIPDTIGVSNYELKVSKL